eukprot:3180926-Pleurochrysis_carterae.AAC.1
MGACEGKGRESTWLFSDKSKRASRRTNKRRCEERIVGTGTKRGGKEGDRMSEVCDLCAGEMLDAEQQ